MSRKKAQATSELITGIFVLSVLTLLVYFTMVISGVDLFRGKSRTYAKITFEQVGGLKAHDSVIYRGTKVGTIEDVTLTTTNLIVTVEMDKSVILREGYKITVCNLSMLGGNYLHLDEGVGNIIDTKRRVLIGTPPTDWMRDVSQIAKNLNELTSAKEMHNILANLDKASASANEIVARIERGQGALGRLTIAQDSLYDDMVSAVTDLREITAKVKRGEGTLGKLFMSDDEVYSELKSSITAFKEACRTFDRTAKTYELGEGAETQMAGVTKEAKNLLTKLNIVASRLERNEGSLGLMASDPKLYNDLTSLIKDCRQIIDNFRDTTPISTFSSLATGAL